MKNTAERFCGSYPPERILTIALYPLKDPKRRTAFRSWHFMVVADAMPLTPPRAILPVAVCPNRFRKMRPWGAKSLSTAAKVVSTHDFPNLRSTLPGQRSSAGIFKSSLHLDRLTKKTYERSKANGRLTSYNRVPSRFTDGFRTSILLKCQEILPAPGTGSRPRCNPVHERRSTFVSGDGRGFEHFEIERRPCRRRRDGATVLRPRSLTA